MIMDSMNYVSTKIHVNSKHGEVVHFRRFDIETTVDIILRRLMDEMSNKEITRIQMDKYYA